MKVKNIEAHLISIPLLRPKKISTRAIPGREYLVVKVITDEGISGWGYTFGTDIELVSAQKVLAEIVIGQDVFNTEKIWSDMYRTTLRWGRKGAVLRAMSAIDIALWDVKAKAAGVPLYKLLGGYKEKVRVYKSSGYYTELTGKDDLEYIEEDCANALERGYTAYKLRVGMDPIHDIKRVETARKTLGDDVDIFVDANNGWDIATSISFGKKLEKLNVAWFEEPLLPDDYAGHAKLAKDLDIPIAAGELEATRWAFQQMIDSHVADILQPDVTVLGGITEWVKVANIAAVQGITVVPHAFYEIHVHLACALPEVNLIEYFEVETDAINIDKIIVDPPKAENGWLKCAEKPGLGFDVDEEKVRHYKIK
jgi:D-arabinonate dehydratase